MRFSFSSKTLLTLFYKILDQDARKKFKGYYKASEDISGRNHMSIELECPICDADIPLDGDEKPGDLILCSFCKVTFKLLKKKNNWVLEEDFDE